jgi:hypothetical protein
MKHIAEHKDNAESVIEHAGFSFLYIRNLSPIPVEEVQYHSAVIVEVKNLDFARLIVSSIRANHSPDIYLKPIFLLKRDTTDYPVLELLSDGIIKGLDELDLIIPDVERIATRVQDLTFTNSISFEAQMITKLISLLYVKEQKIVEPIPYVYSNINYYYPLLSVNFQSAEEHVALKILKIAEDEGILRSDYHDRVYLCSSCSSSHLSYREVCPKCSSSDTTPDDIIHHFPCGYVGPMKDFKNEIDDKLDCPKCNKRLKHIGVYYDKPSVIHECNNCDHKFQDYYVNAKCLSCHSDKSVDSLQSTDIRSYRLTKKGELAAIKGFTTTTRDIDETVGTIKYETLKTMLKYEIERLKQTEGASNICAINISNSSQVYSKLGSDLQRGLLKDLVSVIRSNIRSSDVIAFESSATIVMSMNDIPHKIAKKIIVEMIALLNDLIKTSFEDLEILFDSKVLVLDHSRSHESHLKELMADFS